jgi:hypothetical protein
VENERCSVVRNYMEHSESSGAEAQFRLQCFMSGLKVLTPKEKYSFRGSGLRRRRLCRFAGNDGVEFRFEGRKLSDLRVNFFLLGVELGLALRISSVVGVGKEGILVECVQAQEQVHLFLLIGNLALQSGNFGIRGSVVRSGGIRGGRRRRCGSCFRGVHEL